MTFRHIATIAAVGAGLALAAVSGCSDMFNDASAEANDNWRHARANSSYAEAREKLRLGDLSKARDKADEALELDERHHDARILMAKIDIEDGRYQSALDGLEQVLTWRPDDEEVVFLQAVAHEKLGRLDWALQDYRRAYELDSSDFGAILAATEVLVLMDKVREASDFLAQHLSRADNDPAAYELAGRLAMMLDEYDLAAMHYQRAGDLDMDNADYREAMAMALVYSDQHQHAVAALEEVVEHHDGDAPAWVYAMLGDSYLALGQFVKARRQYEVLCRREPDAAESWLALAKAHAMEGHHTEAVDACYRALELDATASEAKSLLGYVLLKGGQTSRALSLLTQAAIAHPGDATLQCVLGQAYDASGRAGEAQACYAEAARIEPSNRVAWRLLGDTPAPQR